MRVQMISKEQGQKVFGTEEVTGVTQIP